MRVYLDDDLDSDALIGLLQQAGHDVVSPRAVGTRDMSFQQIAQAVTRLEQSGIPLGNAFHNLNLWR